MSITQLSNYDRRSFPRTAIHSDVKCRLPGQEICINGFMIDISHAGVLIGLNEKLQRYSEISLLMESENDYEGPIEIIAEVVRSATPLESFAYTYGCKICGLSGFE